MMDKIQTMDDLLTLLRLALSDRNERKAKIRAFQDYVWARASPITGATEEQWDILNNLALDLDYYEPDPVARVEDGAYYDDSRLESEITETLRILTEDEGNT
jgi:hypothetical protein